MILNVVTSPNMDFAAHFIHPECFALRKAREDLDGDTETKANEICLLSRMFASCYSSRL